MLLMESGSSTSEDELLHNRKCSGRAMSGLGCSRACRQHIPGSSVPQAARGFWPRGDLLADPFTVFMQQAVSQRKLDKFLSSNHICSHGTSKVFNRVAVEAIFLLSIAAPVWAPDTQQQQLRWGPMAASSPAELPLKI